MSNVHLKKKQVVESLVKSKLQNVNNAKGLCWRHLAPCFIRG